MNFDTTHILIRERGFAEILDLALRLFAAHWRPLLLAGVAGIAPWALLNLALLDGFLTDTELWQDPGQYVMWMAALMFLEAPLATAPMTLYLGQATFTQSFSAKRIASEYWRSLPQMVWYQVVWRGVLMLLFITAAIPHIWWPYLSELVLLERNPFFGQRNQSLTTRRRSRNLHRGVAGELLGRWVASLLVGALLFTAIAGGSRVVLWQLTGYWTTELVTFRVLLPLAGWLVLGYFAVVRFLAYLDLRIRREGWEVELSLRSEAARLAKVA